MFRLHSHLPSPTPASPFSFPVALKNIVVNIPLMCVQMLDSRLLNALSNSGHVNLLCFLFNVVVVVIVVVLRGSR